MLVICQNNLTFKQVILYPKQWLWNKIKQTLLIIVILLLIIILFSFYTIWLNLLDISHIDFFSFQTPRNTLLFNKWQHKLILRHSHIYRFWGSVELTTKSDHIFTGFFCIRSWLHKISHPRYHVVIQFSCLQLEIQCMS